MESVTTVVSGTDGTLTLYIDGVAVASGSTNGMTLEQIKNTSGSSGTIGKSFYTADPYFGGLFADFQIYDGAMTAAILHHLGSCRSEDCFDGGHACIGCDREINDS